MKYKIGDTIRIPRRESFTFLDDKDLQLIIAGELPESVIQKYDEIIVDEEYLKMRNGVDAIWIDIDEI